MDREKISVIVPCYNVENYIDRCLKSLEQQTYGIENLEMILVDDASSDDTLAHLLQFEKMYPDQVVVVACEQNGKLGAARNIGMEYASGEYVTFVDSDDVIDATMLEKMADAMSKYHCDEVECGFKSFETSADLFAERDLEQPYFLDLDIEQNRGKFLLSSVKTAVWGKLYKRSFLQDNGLRFLEQIFYEDVHFSGLGMFLMHSYYRINETLYFYFHNQEGIINAPYDSGKVRQETEVMNCLLKELQSRGLLENVIQKFGQEFEWYCLAKCYIDPLVMMSRASVSPDTWKEDIRFFKQYILDLFPNAAENPYLKRQGGVGALGRWLLTVEKSRTEEAFADRGEKNIILINTHEYINIGDHLITEATYQLLEDYYPDYHIIEVTANHFAIERLLLRWVIRRDDVLVIAGGGYLGSLWLGNGEHNVRAIVEDYPHNRIVIFPQSMYYENTDAGIAELMAARKCYEGHHNLHMVLRDERSYVFARNVIPPNVKTYYLPDMALYREYDTSGVSRSGAAVCLRKDKEHVIDRDEVIRSALELAGRKGMEAVETDMLMPEVYPIRFRTQVVDIKAEEFAGYELVVTDRLHCMIYCAITGTPCVAFDNLSQKVSGVYQWITELAYIKVIRDIAELDAAADAVLCADTSVRPWRFLQHKWNDLAALVAPVDMADVT